MCACGCMSGCDDTDATRQPFTEYRVMHIPNAVIEGKDKFSDTGARVRLTEDVQFGCTIERVIQVGLGDFRAFPFEIMLFLSRFYCC
jgi:hypothetical protein